MALSNRTAELAQRHRDDGRRPLARYAPHPTGGGRVRARRGDNTESSPHTEIANLYLRLSVHVGPRAYEAGVHPLSNGAAPPPGPALATKGASVSVALTKKFPSFALKWYS